MFKGHFDAEKADRELRNRYNISFVDLFIKHGFKVYLFGGSLRDMVLGIDWKDADMRVWIPLPPKERDKKTEEILAEAGIDIKAKVIFNDLFTIYRFLPENSRASGVIDFTNVTDQWIVKPDFTVNGLYFDLETKELIDKYDSISDLEKKLLRTAKKPIDQFKDEPQMIFRAVKCACQFGLDIEEETFKALKERSPLVEGVLASLADDTFPGMTEWFMGNIFRGLKYNPALFVKLWNEIGISEVFINFISKRLNLISTQDIVSEPVFEEEKEYGYEESISMFISAVARALESQDTQKVFKEIISLFRLDTPSTYGDFVIDIPKLVYLS